MEVLKEPDWYTTLTEFNDIDSSYLSEQYESFWEEHDNDYLDELSESFGNIYKERRTESQYRKKALTTLMGAFLSHAGSSGRVYEDTGWEFWDLNLFEKEDLPTIDILLAKPDQGKTVAGILLPERKTPKSGVDNSLEAMEDIRDNLNKFEFRASPEDVYSALVVDSPRDEPTSAAIKSSESDLASNIFVWRIYDIEESSNGNSDRRKILDHFSNPNDGSASGQNLRLVDILKDGVEIQNDREILPDFFLDSHHSLFLEHIVGHIVQIREERGDGPLTHFVRKEIKNFISDTLFGTEMDGEASDKTELLISRWDQMGLVGSVGASRNDINGNDFYRFKTPGRMSQDDIIADFVQRYQMESVEFRTEVEAMEWALDNYHDEYGKQTTLTSTYNK